MYFLYKIRFMIEPYSCGLYVNILGDDINTKHTKQGGVESCINILDTKSLFLIFPLFFGNFSRLIKFPIKS